MSRKTMRIILIICLIVLLLGILFIARELILRSKVLRNSKATLLFDQKNYNEAEKYFEKNSIRNPNDNVALSNLAKNKYRLNKYPEAADIYKNMLRNSQSDASDWYDYGNTFYRQQDYRNALKAYRNSLLRNSYDLDAKHNYELTLKQLQQKNNSKQNQQSKPENNKQTPKSQPKVSKPEQQNANNELLNKLKALDQKESNDRLKNTKPMQNDSDRWW